MPETTQTNDWLWYELMSPDPKAAAAFYTATVGWTASQMPAADGVPAYTVLSRGQQGVAGILETPEPLKGVPPHWAGYLRVEDVDGTAGRIRQAGGAVHREPWDIPTVGRVAVVADPEGGKFMLMKPAPAGQGGPPKAGTMEPGCVSWCELHSANENNFDWYAGLFGWQVHSSMDMGPNGTYRMFTTNDLPMTGGTMRKMANSPEASMPTYWLFYFCVDAIDAAIDRAKSAGGDIFMGPHEVPGGTWIALGKDPQGAVFALHSMKR